MSDVIRLICPNLKCRAILTAPSAARGKTVRCRQCAMKVRIPAVAVPSDAAKAQNPTTAS